MVKGNTTFNADVAVISPSRASLIVFFLVAFGIPWTAAITAKLKLVSFSENTPAFMIEAAFCSVAGIVATYMEGGLPAVRDLGRRCVLYRVSVGWWVYALFLPFGVHLGATVLYAASGHHLGPLRPMELVRQWWQLYIFAFAMLQGPLSEELGWRGYPLPRMLGQYSPLKASMLLGIVWAAWHVSILFHSVPADALFALSAIALSILMTVMFLNTRGSVLLAVFMHWSPGKELVQMLFPSADQAPDWLRATVLIAIAVSIVAVTRGKLSVSKSAPK